MSGHSKTRHAATTQTSLAEELRALRVRAGCPGREVAAAAAIDSAAFSKIETGKRLPTPSQLVAMAKFFNTPLVPLEARRVIEDMKRRYGVETTRVAAATILEEESGEYRVNKTSAPVSNRVKAVNKLGR